LSLLGSPHVGFPSQGLLQFAASLWGYPRQGGFPLGVSQAGAVAVSLWGYPRRVSLWGYPRQGRVHFDMDLGVPRVLGFLPIFDAVLAILVLGTLGPQAPSHFVAGVPV
jgi:hypothetical protein